MNKTLEILIVEDNKKHQQDALDAFKPLIDSGLVNITLKENYQDGIDSISEKDYVVTDLFMPYSETKTHDTPLAKDLFRFLDISKFMGSFDIIEAAYRWLDEKDLAPYGAFIAKEAKEKNINYVICTDTNHHGYATEPINCMFSSELVDAPANRYGSASKKNWDNVIQKLIASQFANDEEILSLKKKYNIVSELGKEIRNISSKKASSIFNDCSEIIKKKTGYDLSEKIEEHNQYTFVLGLGFRYIHKSDDEPMVLLFR